MRYDHRFNEVVARLVARECGTWVDVDDVREDFMFSGAAGQQHLEQADRLARVGDKDGAKSAVNDCVTAYVAWRRERAESVIDGLIAELEAMPLGGAA